ncbi:MAG TPA: hypothetical protein VD907_06280 [Verrucomicrobiae bacterium]|nr:hypothetical protein [Verrucomicrobiae bacterium]
MAATNTTLKWTPQTASATAIWNSVVWSPELNIFVAAAVGATNNVMRSTDGITWTTHSTPVATNIRDVVWAASIGKFVAVTPTGLTFSSTDGATWVSEGAIPTPQQWWETITWSPELGMLVAISCGIGGTGCNNNPANRVATSTDGGATWTTHPDAGDFQYWFVDWSSELGLFVATAQNGGTQGVMTSPDGINWTPRTTPVGAWWGLTYSPDLNLYVVVGTDGKIMTSPDAITWTQRTAPVANQWRSVAWSPELSLFVAVGNTGTNRIMTSPDGINWTARPAVNNNTWKDITWSPARHAFVAVGDTGGASQVMTGAMVTATTTSATSITGSTATLRGDYLDNYPGASVFFRYRVAGSGGAFTSTPIQSAPAQGSFSANITGLSPNTTYEYTVVVQWPSATGTQEIQGGFEQFTTLFSQVHYRKTVSPVVTSITPGQTFTYTVAVENVGTTPLTGLSFTDDLSDVVDDAVYNNNVTSGGTGTASWNGSNEINWNGNLAIGQTATITYSFTMNDPVTGNGTLRNSVVGTGAGSNCTANPAVDPECMTVSPLPVISSQKTLVGPANPKAGDTVDYQFTITNTGGAAATGVAVADNLVGVLDDATYNNDASASTGTITYDAGSKRVIWNGDLAASGSPGDSVTVSYSVDVNGADNLGDAMLNNALITSDCPNPAIFNPATPGYEANCVTSTPVAAWTAVKTTAAANGIKLGETANYTITVTNTGAVNLTGASAPALDDDLTDVIDDADFDSANAQATIGTVSYASLTLHWTGNLNAGQTATITYGATVKPQGSLGNASLANAIGAGPMNCPVTPTANPSDPSFNASCATLTSIDTTDPGTGPGGPTTPPNGSSSGGLADTGQNILWIILGVVILLAGGIVGLFGRNIRKLLKSN